MAKLRPGWALRTLTSSLATFLLLGDVSAHSAVERLMRIANNGTMIGTEGVPRGFFGRDTAGFNDLDMVYLIPPNGRPDGKVIHPDDFIAHPAQRQYNYTLAKPLVAAPGDLIALQYQENGHTTLPQNQPNKPLNRGTVYIYGTSDLSEDAKLLDIHYKWNPLGTGGDGKGKLLATRNYDDGKCYQINGNTISTDRQKKFPVKPEPPMNGVLWCQNDVLLPSDLPPNSNYTLIWVWDWPTMDRADVKVPPSSAPGAPPGENGAKVVIPELYTTVMDILIVDPCSDALGGVKSPKCASATGVNHQTFSMQETDLNVAADPTQVQNLFIVDVSALFDNGTKSSPTGFYPTGSGSSNTASAGSSQPTSSKPPGGGGGGRVKTTTVYASVTTTTVTVQPSADTPPPSAVATVHTTTFYTKTITSTTTPAGTAAVAPTTSPGARKGAPSVTNFLPGTTPAVAKSRRREVGQWGFGRGHHHA